MLVTVRVKVCSSSPAVKDPAGHLINAELREQLAADLLSHSNRGNA